MSDLYDPAGEDDAVDVVVDSWTERLRKGRPIWFERLWHEDIEGRKAKQMEKPADKGKGAQTGNKDDETESIFMNALKDLKDEMVAGFAYMGAKIESLTQKLVQLEETVKGLTCYIPIRTQLQNNEEETEKEKDKDGAEEEKEAEKEKEGEAEKGSEEVYEAEGEKEAEDKEAEEETEGEGKKDEEEKEDDEETDTDGEENEQEEEENDKEKEGLEDEQLIKTLGKRKRKKSYSVLKNSPFQVRETRLAKRGRNDDDVGV